MLLSYLFIAVITCGFLDPPAVLGDPLCKRATFTCSAKSASGCDCAGLDCAKNQWLEFVEISGNCKTCTVSCCDCPAEYLATGVSFPCQCTACSSTDEFAAGKACIPKSCKTPNGDTNCDFYTKCLDAAYPCGTNGYVQSFGNPYCQAFLNDKPKYSPSGQQWTSKVRQCLQEALVPLLSANANTIKCNTIRDFAFESHPKCYIDSGICNGLPPKDLAILLWSISKEVVNFAAWKQALQVAKGCGAQYIEAAKGAIADFTFSQPLKDVENAIGDAATDVLDSFYRDYIQPYFPPSELPFIPPYNIIPWSVESGSTRIRFVFLADDPATATQLAQAMVRVVKNVTANGVPGGSLNLTFQSSTINLTQSISAPTSPTPKTVAPTKPPTVIITVPPGLCFSGANTVEVEGKGVVPIHSLKIGDMVKDANDKMVTVYSFGHYQASILATYLQIHTQELRAPLEVSSDHLVFVQGQAVPASKIVIGDLLDLGGGNSMTSKVTKIRQVTRLGAYAPFTTSGTIMVSGIASSNYVTLQEGSSVLMIGNFRTPLTMHWLAHIFQAHHRLVCQWSPNNCKMEKYTADGISTWVHVPLQMSQWLTGQGGVVTATVLPPILMLGLLMYAVEIFFLNGFVILFLVAVVGFAFACAKHLVSTKRTMKVKVI